MTLCGGEGGGDGGGSERGVVSVVLVKGRSMCAVLRRSKEITVGWPLQSIVYCFAERESTRYGPLYGCCNVFLTALNRTKTCEQWESASLTCVRRPDGCLGGMATSLFEP